MKKYPRTRHLEGSRLQPGDEDLDQVPLDDLRGRHVVIEEKLDGANAGLSLDGDRLLLQSRGHYLTGGPRETHFDLFKRWAAAHAAVLRDLLRGGLVLYGEWLYAHHTVRYDALPHYFLEFDVRDPDDTFWSTARRRAHLAGSPVRSVPVLWEGILDDPAALPRLVRRSLYGPDDAEGLYIKVEEDGRVVERYKWVRTSFLTEVLDSGGHWLDRPIVPNRLADGVDLFAP